MGEVEEKPAYSPDALMRDQLILEAGHLAGQAYLNLIGVMLRLESAGIDPDELAGPIEELGSICEEVKAL